MRIRKRIEVMIERGGQTLLTKHENGQWGLPGGGIEPTQSAHDAALCECMEEIGIRICDIRLNHSCSYSLSKEEKLAPREGRDALGSSTIIARAYFGEWDDSILGRADDKLEFEWVPTNTVTAKLEASNKYLFNAKRLDTLRRLDEQGASSESRIILKEGIPYAEFRVCSDGASCTITREDDVFEPMYGVDIIDILSWDTLVIDYSIDNYLDKGSAFVRYPVVGTHDTMVIMEGKFVK